MKSHEVEALFTREHIEEIFTREGKRDGGLRLSESLKIIKMETLGDDLHVEFEVHTEYIN